MPASLTRRRPRKRWLGVKPPIGFALDPSHPSVAGSFHFWPLNEGGGTAVIDQGTGRVGSFTGSPTWGAGPSLSGFTTSAYVVLDPPAPIVGVAYPHWTATLASCTASTRGFPWTQGNTGFATQFLCVDWNYTGNNTLNYALRDDAGSGTQAASGVTISNLNDGKPHVVQTVSYSASDHRLYFDGAQVLAYTTAVTTFTLNCLSLGILRRSTISLPFAGTVYGFAGGSGSVPEPRAMAADFYGAFLGPRARRSFVAGGPSPITGTLGAASAVASVSFAGAESFLGTLGAAASSATVAFAGAETFSGILGAAAASGSVALAGQNTPPPITGVLGAAASTASVDIVGDPTVAAGRGLAPKPALPRLWRRQGMPMAAWPMGSPRGTFPSDAGDVADATGRRRAAIRQAGCSYGTGQAGRCLKFDGSSNAYASTPDNLPLSGNPAFTVAFSMFMNASSAQGLLGFGDAFGTYPNPTAFGVFYGLRGSGGVLSVEWANGNPAYVNTPVPTGLWHRVVVTKSPGAVNSTTRIWVDGVDQGAMDAGSASVTPAITAGPMALGRFANDNVDPCLAGMLDNVQVYDYPWTSGDVLRDARDPWWRYRKPSRAALLAATVPSAPAITGVLGVAAGAASVDLEGANPLAGIDSLSILPSGNTIGIFCKRLSDNSLSNITALPADNVASIRVNGGAPIPITRWAASGNEPWAWAPLARRFDPVIVDELDAGCVLTGSWIANPLSANSFIWLGDKAAYSTVASDQAVYTFPSLLKGNYKAAITLDLYFGGGAPGGGSPSVRFRVQGPGGLDTSYYVDQTAPIPYDLSDLKYRWHYLGAAFAVAADATTITVTVTNAAGGGTAMIVDAVRIERLTSRADSAAIVAVGDTVTFSAPNNWLQTAAGTLAQSIGTSVALLTDSQWFPFNPAAPRTMGIGFNIGSLAYFDPNHLYADRIKGGSSQWFNAVGGGFYDVDGKLIGITAGGTVEAFIQEAPAGSYPHDPSNGWDYFGFPNAPVTGPWQLIYTTPPGGAPVLRMLELTPYGVTFSPSSNSGTGPQVFAQTPSLPDRLHVYSPSYAVLASSQGSTQDYPIDLKVFDPNTAPSWTKLTHPVAYNRLANRGFRSERFMDTTDTNGNCNYDYADLARAGKLSVALPTRTLSANVVAVHPVDLNTGTDADQLYRWAAFPGTYDGVPFLKVEFTGAHPFHSGMWLTPNLTDQGPWTGNAPSAPIGINAGGAYLALEITGQPNFCLLKALGGGGANPNPGSPETLAASHATTGTFAVSMGVGMPIADIMTHAGEVGIDPWICDGLIESAACVAAKWAEIASTLPLGRKVRHQVSNEVWNSSLAFTQTPTAVIMAEHATWLYANDPTNPEAADTNNSQRWLAFRENRNWTIARAAFAAVGRAADHIAVMGAQAGNAGLTTGGQLGYLFTHGLTPPEELAIALYFDNNVIGSNYDTLDGGLMSLAQILDSYRGLDIDGLVDIFGFHLLHSRAYTTFIKPHQDLLNDPSFGSYFANVKMVEYESGFSFMAEPPYLANNGYVNPRWKQRSMAVVRSPRMYRVKLADCQQLQNAPFYISLVNQYTLDAPNGADQGTPWDTWLGDLDGIGTGTPGENPNPADLAHTVSETGGAYIFWASGSDTGELTASAGPAVIGFAGVVTTGSAIVGTLGAAAAAASVLLTGSEAEAGVLGASAQAAAVALAGVVQWHGTIAGAAQVATVALVGQNTPPAPTTGVLAVAASGASVALAGQNTPPATTGTLGAAAGASTVALAGANGNPATLGAAATGASVAFAGSTSSPPVTGVLAAAAGRAGVDLEVFSLGGIDLKQAITASLLADATVTAICGSGIYPTTLPQTAVPPALGYWFTGSYHDTNLLGAAGMRSVNVRFEILTRLVSDMEALAEAVRNRFQGLIGPMATLPIAWVSLEDERDRYEEPLPGSDLGTHCKEFDFVFKLRETHPTLS